MAYKKEDLADNIFQNWCPKEIFRAYRIQLANLMQVSFASIPKTKPGRENNSGKHSFQLYRLAQFIADTYSNNIAYLQMNQKPKILKLPGVL